MNKIKFKMKNYDENIKLMQKKINKYSDNIWYPDINIKLTKSFLCLKIVFLSFVLFIIFLINSLFYYFVLNIVLSYSSFFL